MPTTDQSPSATREEILAHAAPLGRQYFQCGFWKAWVIEKHPGSVQRRHLAPIALVLGLLGSLLSALSYGRRWLLLSWAVYGGGVMAASTMNARSSLRRLTRLVGVFPCLHLSNGTGFLLAPLRDGGQRAPGI